jgi:tetratricopeptide (TPR) repeat protein
MAGLESVREQFTELQLKKQPANQQQQQQQQPQKRAGAVYPSTHANQAIAAFEQEAKLPPTPDSPEIITKLVRNSLILVDNREYKLAINLLRNVLMRKPNEPRALRWLGHCLREENRLGEATKCFEAFYKAMQTNEAASLYAEVLYLSGRDQEAFAVYTDLLMKVTEASPEMFDIYKNLGNIHVRAGDFDAAEECYHKANTVRADSDILMVNYGTLEIQRENFSEAVERFRRAVEINPGNDKAWVGLALVHRQMGDFELANGNVERALDINPRNKTALNVLVEWNSNDKDFSASVRRLKEYLAVESEDAEMSFLLARILVQQNHMNDALIEMERALTLDPSLEGADRLMNAIENELARRMECQ